MLCGEPENAMWYLAMLEKPCGLGIKLRSYTCIVCAFIPVIIFLAMNIKTNFLFPRLSLGGKLGWEYIANMPKIE